MPLKTRDLDRIFLLPSFWRIVRSRIFDANWYRIEYPECGAQVFGPIVHYLVEGARRGARPHLLFDPAWYQRGRKGTQKDPNPLIDYIRFGAAEGFEPSPYFSSPHYCKNAGPLGSLTPLGHFIAHGARNSVPPTPLFDQSWYLDNNPDVRRAGFDAFLHFVASGARDGRSPGPLFDAAWYRMKNADVRDRGLEPLAHYLAVGAIEGRKPNECFDGAFYVANSPEPCNAPEQALVDYATDGRLKWRSTHAVLPPPASPVAAFEDFPWRRSAPAQQPFGAPFRVLIVNLGPAQTDAPAAVAELCAALTALPSLDVYMLTNAGGAADQAGVLTLDLARCELASLQVDIVLDRLLRALKFRDANALVIEMQCAIAPLARICAGIGLSYQSCDAAIVTITLDWNDLLRQRIGYRATQRSTVSAIIPNYNHARYLDERLRSIFAQSARPDEIIFLDDGSSDGSIQIAESWKAKSNTPFTILESGINSGSPFMQWAKGLAQANCDLVWIAESDDSSDPRFLERVAESFKNPDIVLGYSDSETIGPDGEILSRSYRYYTDSIDELKWLSGYVEIGSLEIETALSIKNTIPNVSAVLFRRSALNNAIEQIQNFRYCGDWLAYILCLRQGKISFCPQALNRHRQDPNSVTRDGERATVAVREALAIKRAVFAALDDADPVAWVSLAQTIFEYELRSLTLTNSRPPFTANSDLAAPIGEMSDLIAKHMAPLTGREEAVARYLRALAESSVTLDSVAREILIARVMNELQAVANRKS